MTDKELRRLRRDDLLQILINQQKELDDLNAALDKAKEELEKKRIAIQESGSVAEAALRLNGVFEAAQAAADQYEEQMRAEADEMRAHAEIERDNAKKMVEDATRSARTEAERILSKARDEAEHMKAEAQALLDEARQRTGVEPPPLRKPPAEEAKPRRGLFGGRKKA